MVEARIDLSEIRVLDLYAGTGALGLEALSRGAGAVDMVESDRMALAVAKENVIQLAPELPVSFHESDVFLWMKSHADLRYQLILADPPYDSMHSTDLIHSVLPMLDAGGLFVFEHPRHVKLDDLKGHLNTRTYGKSAVSLFSQSTEGA